PRWRPCLKYPTSSGTQCIPPDPPGRRPYYPTFPSAPAAPAYPASDPVRAGKRLICTLAILGDTTALCAGSFEYCCEARPTPAQLKAEFRFGGKFSCKYKKDIALN